MKGWEGVVCEERVGAKVWIWWEHVRISKELKGKDNKVEKLLWIKNDLFLSMTVNLMFKKRGSE